MIYVANQAQITTDWEEVRPMIESCLAESSEPVTIFDMYHLLRLGAAFLLVSRDTHGRLNATSTLTIDSPPMHPEVKYLHIWHAYSKNPEVTCECNGVIKDFARASGCSVVTLKGTRPAFERWGKNLGFTRVCTEFKLEL